MYPDFRFTQLPTFHHSAKAIQNHHLKRGKKHAGDLICLSDRSVRKSPRLPGSSSSVAANLSAVFTGVNANNQITFTAREE